MSLRESGSGVGALTPLLIDLLIGGWLLISTNLGEIRRNRAKNREDQGN